MNPPPQDILRCSGGAFQVDDRRGIQRLPAEAAKKNTKKVLKKSSRGIFDIPGKTRGWECFPCLFSLFPVPTEIFLYLDIKPLMW